MLYALIIIIILCGLFVIFLEICEVSIFVVSQGYLKSQSKKLNYNDNPYDRIIYLKKNIKEVLVVLLILDNLVAYLMNFYFTNILTDMKFSYGAMNFIIVIYSFIMIFLIMMAKMFGVKKPDIFINYCANFFFYIFKICAPISTLFSKIAEFFFSEKVLNTKERIEGYKNELISSLESFNEEKDTPEEIDMAKSALSIRDITLEQIMTHKNDFISIEKSTNIEKMKKQLKPVSHKKHVILYNDNEDNIVGTINSYSFFVDYAFGDVTNIKDYITEPKYFIQTTSAYNALEFFKTNTKYKVLFIIDEDGNICGLITISDIIGDIFGEIEEDVYDYYFEQKDNGYLIEGNYSIRVLNRKLDLNLPEENSTVSGLLISFAKKLPTLNQKFIFNNVQFIIVERSNKKIDTVFIEIMQKLLI